VAPTDEDPQLTHPPADSREATVRSAAIMSGGTLLSRATGLVRVSVTLAALGVTALSDAYNQANTTPNIIYELVLGGILTSVFLPVLVSRAKSGDRTEQFEAASRFLTIALVLLSGVAVAGALAAPWIMRLYLSGVGDPIRKAQEVELGTFFLRWFMPQIVFYGIGAVAAGLLTANRRFAAQMYAPVLNNLAVIATMLAFIAIRGRQQPAIATVTWEQKTLLAAGTTFGVLAMTVALWPALHTIGFRWKVRWDWRHETVRHLARLARWVIVYVAANQIAYFLIINLNGRVGTGAYTVYSQAFIFFSLPHAILAVSIFTALLPGIAERWGGGDRAGIRELFSRGFRDTMIAMIPAAAGYAVLAGPIVGLLAAYGHVSGVDRDVLARTLAAFAVGLPFFSAFQLLTRTFYALHDARTPAIVNVGAAVVNIGADILFAFGFRWGVWGLALGHGASYAVGSAVLFVILRGRLGGIDGRRIGTTLAKTAAAAAAVAIAAAGAALLVGAVLNVERPVLRLIQVAAGVSAGVLVFLTCAFMFGIREVDEVRTALLARFRR
jgi:putative peptidoglycan lipid II flippase